MSAAPAPRPAVGALDALFGALADPTRRALVERLVRDGPASATALTSSFALSRQAVVKHLQALEAVGLVTPERVGREVRFRATPEPLASAVGWLLDAGGSWDRRIDRLRTIAAARPPAAPARPSTTERGEEARGRPTRRGTRTPQ